MTWRRSSPPESRPWPTFLHLLRGHLLPVGLDHGVCADWVCRVHARRRALWHRYLPPPSPHRQCLSGIPRRQIKSLSNDLFSQSARATMALGACAQLNQDGKVFGPDGKPATALILPAFGLARVNLHTWNGWGSVSYWNAVWPSRRCTGVAPSMTRGSTTSRSNRWPSNPAVGMCATRPICSAPSRPKPAQLFPKTDRDRRVKMDKSLRFGTFVPVSRLALR